MADNDEPKGLPPASGDRGIWPTDPQVPYVPPGDVPAPPPAFQGSPEWREFQEFQRFKEFQRGELPPAKRRPLWLKVLLGKWVRRLVFLLILFIAAGWAYQHYFGDPNENLPAAQTGGGSTNRTQLYSDTPKEAVRMLYDNIAQNTPIQACSRFESEAIGQKFANAFNAPDCLTAMKRLNAEVGTANDYAEPTFPPPMKLVPDINGIVVISSCEMIVRDGPRLGKLTVKKIPDARGEQWIISDYAKETCPTVQPTG
ncbi:hypothetical protein [Alloactinosynnema sp. L-07]|uniref:hypothetical protein n=1 Tax=Alloactinosynnema sp. L-07 TaxID=1653480 RepID=UPI00065F01BD|nr:hypothetical protein [Alloactinosynnema sp. L-07]CRK60081.1 hypothetical protein [Alloactinosynnema sp. L-07]